jgi:hypothetical protein
MSTKTIPQKTECLNPNTGGSMKIDSEVYDLFSKTIYHTLKKENILSFTGIVEGVEDCFKKEKVKFKKSIPWYAVTVKNDMEARGVIESFTEKGKKLHRIKEKTPQVAALSYIVLHQGLSHHTLPLRSSAPPNCLCTASL